jgi:cation:H+ antiporter
MDVFILILLFVTGVIVIVKGGDLFVEAATWIAEVSGMPKFVVGATVVSLATTLPEIIVSSIAAYEGKVDLAIGNAIGSVIANTGLIMSISVFFMPVVFKRKQLLSKAALFIASIIALWSLSFKGELTVGRSVIMFILFTIFIIENIKSSKSRMAGFEIVRCDKKTVLKNAVKFIIGTAGIIIGSDLLVDNGSAIARYMGVSENIIGLTAIAIGTSLPELVTTITAIMKKESSLSVGNILGANVIDLAMILPISAMISKGSIPVPASTLLLDLPVCLLIACVLLVPSLVKGKFMRWQGLVSLSIYSVYLVKICIC